MTLLLRSAARFIHDNELVNLAFHGVIVLAVVFLIFRCSRKGLK